MKPMATGRDLPQRQSPTPVDHSGYKGSAKVGVGQRLGGLLAGLPREAGYYRPVDNPGNRGISQDVSDIRKMNREVKRSAAVRRNGKQTGVPSSGDSSIDKGAVGNSKGSAPPGLGHGTGVMGSPATHKGTSGRGAPGRFGKADKYTGKPKAYSESISHSDFEALGAK